MAGGEFAAVSSVVLCVALLGTWLGVLKHPSTSPFKWSGSHWELRVSREGVEVNDASQVAFENRTYQEMTAAHKKLLASLQSRTPPPIALWDQYEEDDEKLKELSLKLRPLPERHLVSFPTLMVLALVPAAYWTLSRWRAARAVPAGHCRVCG